MVRLYLLVLIIMLWFTPVFSQGPGNLTAPNRHNLSATSGNPIRAVSETQICVFCHTPHRALTETPLWNKSLSTAQYTVSVKPGSTGTQLSSPLNPPDGDSKLCLSCHDGTIPLGNVLNLGGQPTTISMTQQSLPSWTDLSGHHLVSIEYNSALAADKAAQCGSVQYRLVDPPPQQPYLQRTRNIYDPNCQDPLGCSDPNNWHMGVQCTSCHDAHYDPDPVGRTTAFLRQGIRGSWTSRNYTDPLCLTCHTQCP